MFLNTINNNSKLRNDDINVTVFRLKLNYWVPLFESLRNCTFVSTY